MTPFEIALSRIDHANAEDPNTVLDGGAARPADLVYSERMTEMLQRFRPGASEALRLAVRAQHLRRWTVARDTYPMDRAGYHRWRGELKRRHADWAAEILEASGIDADTIGRVGGLIRKEKLKSDPDSQALEDVACLVFLQHYAAEFAAKHPPEKMTGILQKTWKKMSEAGQAAALRLPLDASVRSLVVEALSTVERPRAQSIPLTSIAVILAAHGDRGGSEPNATLLRHCAALAEGSVFHSVAAGTLRGDPALEVAVRSAIHSGAKLLAIFPMFMADGYFTRKVLTERLAQLEIPIDVQVLPPLGADPRLPALMVADALATAEANGVAPEAARLLVVGHGSKIGPASADATRVAAGEMAKSGRFGSVETAFLEEAEFLEDALRREAQTPTIVVGFFSGDGLHAGEDVPEAIATTGAAAFYAGSAGASPAVTELVRRALIGAFSAPTEGV